jgi:hypothetical protein
MSKMMNEKRRYQVKVKTNAENHMSNTANGDWRDVGEGSTASERNGVFGARCQKPASLKRGGSGGHGGRVHWTKKTG